MPWERRTRSLMAQGIVVFLLLTAGSGVSWLAGCGPTVGQIIKLRAMRTIYLDEAYYRQAAELKRAGGEVGLATDLEAAGTRKWELVYAGSEIRIINTDRDGYKVQVVEAARNPDPLYAAEAEKLGIPRDDERLKDRVGWMTKDAIDSELH